MKVPKKVLDRFIATIKPFQQVAESHKKRDVSEADTVTLVKDILADTFGFNKYEELTSEQQIKGTFCDLAVKIGRDIKYLIEVKSAGIDLNANHLRQAQQYGSTEGVEWLVLTNSIDWKLYRLKKTIPLTMDEVCSFNLLTINPKSDDDAAKLFLFCREGIGIDAMDTFHQHISLLNKYTIAQVLQMESVNSVVRKEMKRLFPELKVDTEQIGHIISTEVFKREVLEDDRAKEAADKIRKIVRKLEKQNLKKSDEQDKAEQVKAGAPMMVELHEPNPVESIAVDVDESELN